MKILSNGCTRLVFLIGKWAIKIPRFDYGWAQGLRGLLANLQERDFSSLNYPIACPVVFCLWGGWLNIMPRCEPLNQEQWDDLPKQCPGIWLPIPVEYRKRCSFGVLNGRVVAVDYGS